MSSPDPIVDIIAPASACERSRLDAGLQTLREWGLEPRVPNDLFGPRGMVAHDDAQRLAMLQRALRAPDSKLIWCVRGGYGSLRLLQKLARRAAPLPSKRLLGFSDVSALQCMLHAHHRLSSVHAPVVAQLSRNQLQPATLKATRSVALALARGESCEVRAPRLSALNEAAAADRVVRGTLLGTNLETVRSLIGTPWQPSGKGVIWCFEDVGERGYEVDRALEQMSLAGLFDGTKAVLFGDFSNDLEPTGRSLVPRVLKAFGASMRVPVLRGLPIGHGRRNLPLFVGGRAQVQCGGQASLVSYSG